MKKIWTGISKQEAHRRGIVILRLQSQAWVMRWGGQERKGMRAHLGIAGKQVRLRSLRVGIIKLQAVLPVNVSAEQLREPREHHAVRRPSAQPFLFSLSSPFLPSWFVRALYFGGSSLICSHASGNVWRDPDARSARARRIRERRRSRAPGTCRFWRNPCMACPARVRSHRRGCVDSASAKTRWARWPSPPSA